MAGIILSALVVIVSTAIYTWLVWWADRYEKEPKALFFSALIWGALPAVFIALLLEVGIRTPKTFLGEFVASSLIAPIAEEGAKGAALVLICWLSFQEFDDVVDGLVYGALVGFGFGMTENYLYFVHSLSSGGWHLWGLLVLLRQGVFGLNHAFYTAFTGLGCGLTREHYASPHARLYALGGFAAAVIAHAVHNATITLTQHTMWWFLVTLLFDGGGILLLLLILFLALRREKRVILQELADEVGTTFSEDEYKVILAALGFRPLVDIRNRKVWAQHRQLRQLAAELALKKRELRTDGDSRELRLKIAQLRARIVTIFHPPDKEASEH